MVRTSTASPFSLVTTFNHHPHAGVDSSSVGTLHLLSWSAHVQAICSSGSVAQSRAPSVSLHLTHSCLHCPDAVQTRTGHLWSVVQVLQFEGFIPFPPEQSNWTLLEMPWVGRWLTSEERVLLAGLPFSPCR